MNTEIERALKRGAKPTRELKLYGRDLAKYTGCPSDRVEDLQSWLIDWQLIEVKTSDRFGFTARGAELLLRSWGK